MMKQTQIHTSANLSLKYVTVNHVYFRFSPWLYTKTAMGQWRYMMFRLSFTTSQN